VPHGELPVLLALKRPQQDGRIDAAWPAVHLSGDRVAADAEDRWAAQIGPEQLEQLRNGLIQFVDDAASRGPVTLRPVW
jgi:hypothetical protein